ncbi:Polynucleotide adenylyltransferase [Bertholletia excelsa]
MLSSTSVLSASAHMSVDAQSWAVADQSAQEILSTIRPTVASDCKRHKVIYYLQSLMREHFEVEVLPLGSVPLKTYLPGADIDLTIVCDENRKEVLDDICTFLQCGGEKNTEFVVNSVEYVPAQVAVVKCIVQDIAVDISFNQIAGYSAVHFLEKKNGLQVLMLLEMMV